MIDIVDRVLSDVDFSEPVEMVDIETVYKRLKKALPNGAIVEGVLRREGVVFEIRNGTETIRRVKPIVKETA